MKKTNLNRIHTNLDTIQKATTTSMMKETGRQTKRRPSKALVGLNHKLHKNQLKNKMFKTKKNSKN